jgi:hypothetical protein
MARGLVHAGDRRPGESGTDLVILLVGLPPGCWEQRHVPGAMAHVMPSRWRSQHVICCNCLVASLEDLVAVEVG